MEKGEVTGYAYFDERGHLIRYEIKKVTSLVTRKAGDKHEAKKQARAIHKPTFVI